MNNINSLQSFLDNFVKSFQLDESEPDLVDMETTEIVLNSIEKNMELNNFIDIIKNNNYENTFTGLFLCDFDRSEDIILINVVENYNGIYNVQLNSNISENTELDKENNEIYAVFPNPIDCYNCLLEIKNIENNKKIEGLEDFSHLL
tara:strand:+ start:1096 stop:1536 length:441 start_codon:yes stop_codon:yes gene_type:complete